jgi:hypothetical protein
MEEGIGALCVCVPCTPPPHHHHTHCAQPFPTECLFPKMEGACKLPLAGVADSVHIIHKKAFKKNTERGAIFKPSKQFSHLFDTNKVKSLFKA